VLSAVQLRAIYAMSHSSFRLSIFFTDFTDNGFLCSYSLFCWE